MTEILDTKLHSKYYDYYHYNGDVNVYGTKNEKKNIEIFR